MSGVERCLHPCPDCPFGGPKVGSKGDPQSPIVYIGESPGKNELRDGIPFTGDSGKMLDKANAQVPNAPEPYYINALQCSPGKREEKNPAILEQATKACRHHVLKELALAPRKVIVAMGNPALWTITENYDLKITAERGKFLPTQLAEIGLVPTVHPAFVMSGGQGGSFQQFMRDIKYGIDLVQGRPPKKPPRIEFEVAQDISDLLRWALLFRTTDYRYIATDLETTGFDSISDKILCIGFSGFPELVHVVPRHLLPFIGMLFDNDSQFIWHNGKFDVRFLWRDGITNARVDHDTMLLSYSLDEIGGIHDLETVASDWLNSPPWKAMLEHYLPKGGNYGDIPTPILHEYMAYDIGNTRALFDILKPLVWGDAALGRLYTRTLIPASRFLANVERNGLYVDKAKLYENDTAYRAKLDVLAEPILEVAKQFPEGGYTEKLPRSWKQLSRLIYGDLGIKKIRNSESTDNETLEKLPQVPVVVALRAYRKEQKEYGTYIKPLVGTPKKPSIIRADGCTHSTYLLHGTRTGRLASREPNLQNVPRNPVIRGQYIPAPGNRFVEVDLNQAELRVLADLSKDEVLCQIYNTAGMSIHDVTRLEVFKEPKDWTPAILQQHLIKFRLTPDTRYDENGEDLLVAEQKMKAKNINFGIPYGITEQGLAEQTGFPVKDCKDWLDKWRNKFKGAAAFLDACEEAPFNGKTLVTPFGNKKRPNCVSKELARGISNEYKNFPEQSCASHFTLHAGIECWEELWEEHGGFFVNIIHDALLFEICDDDAVAMRAARLVKGKMEDVPKKWGFKRVPFIAEGKWGYRWGSLTKMKGL